MANKIRAAITAVSGVVPPDVITNADLEKLVETNDEWIVTRTGIKERRIYREEGKGTMNMVMPAVREVLIKSNTSPEEIELIICATTTPDYVFPATANLIGADLGALNAFGYDVQAACSGFLYALVTGSQFIESGKFKKVLVVGADKMSSIINYKDRATCIIFGDGGGAVMLEPDTEGFGIQDSILRSDGNGAQYLMMDAGGSRRPPSHETVDKCQHVVRQEGATVFKFAVTNMSEVAAQVMEKNNLKPEDIAWLVPHQANKRIIEATANRCGIPMERVMLNIEKYGNTTNGTLPLCLWEYESRMKKGDNILLAAFGGGFTWGAVLLKWAYDTEKQN
jgi:3-oxoacyl-[acyl-carrier-protein] synthase-3